jgi:hypothetical protein
MLSAAEIAGVTVPLPAITAAPDLTRAALYRRQIDGGHTCRYTSVDPSKSVTPIQLLKISSLNKYISQQAQISAIPDTIAIGRHHSAPLAK